MTDYLDPKNDTGLNTEAATYSLLNPIAAPADVQLADQTRLPVDFVQRNRQQIEREQQQDNFKVMLGGNEHVANWVNSDEANAAIVSDRPGFLGEVGNWFGNVGSAYTQGSNLVRINSLRAAENFRPLTPAELAEIDELKAMPAMKMDMTNAGLVQSGAQQIPNLMASVWASTTGAVPGATAGGTVGGLVGGPVGAAVGATRGAWAGGTTGAALMSYTLLSGEARDNLLSVRGLNGEQLDPNVIRGASVATGMVSGGIELLPFGVVVKHIPVVGPLLQEGAVKILRSQLEKIPGFSSITDPFTAAGMRKVLQLPGAQQLFYNFGKRIVEIGLVEGATEGAQQGVSIAAQNISQNMSQGEFRPVLWDEAKEQIRQNAVAGAMGGIAVGGSIAAVNLPFDASRQRAYSRDAAAQAQTINSGAQANADIIARSPERFQTLFQSITGDERFYIDKEAFSKMLDGLDEATKNTVLNGVTDLSSEIANSDDHVSIRKSDYSAYIAPLAQSNSLVEHIKLDPADQSLAQRQEMESIYKNNAQMVEEVKREMAQQSPQPQALSRETLMQRVAGKNMVIGDAPVYDPLLDIKTMPRTSTEETAQAVEQAALSPADLNGVMVKVDKDGKSYQVEASAQARALARNLNGLMKVLECLA